MSQSTPITTIRSVLPIHIDRQLVLDRPKKPDSPNRIAIVPIENLDELRQDAQKKKSVGHNIVFHVRLGLPSSKLGKSPSYAGLVGLLGLGIQELDPEPGETPDQLFMRTMDAWYASVCSYGTDRLRVNLEVLEDQKVQRKRSSQVVSHETLSTLYTVGDLVIVDVNSILLALPGVPEIERQAVAIRNEIYGYQTPQAVLEAAQQIRRKRSTSAGASSKNAAHALPVIAVAPNGPAERALYHVLAQDPRQWQTNEHEATKYFQTSQVIVTYQPTEIVTESWFAAREATLEALDKRFRSIRNDLAADVADILFHHWNAHAKPNTSPMAVERVAVTLSKICEYRGIKPTPAAIQMLYEALRDVRAISLNDGTVNEHLFDISTVELQPPLWHCETAPQKDTGLVYSPGFFLSKAVEGEPRFEAPFMRRMWELDPYRHQVAKRLARYLRGEWRMNAGTYLGNDGDNLLRFRRLKDILDDAGISYKGAEATKDPSRFITSFESEIDVLYSEGVIREGCPYIYHLEDRERRDNLPRKGVLARWLELRVRLDPPAEVRDVLARYHSRRLAHQARAKALPESKKRTRNPRSK